MARMSEMTERLVFSDGGSEIYQEVLASLGLVVYSL